jgi:hypothetical protein
MSAQCIDADFKSEERYSKISISYSNDEELKKIENALTEAHKSVSLEESTYTTDIADGRKVFVVEYHDDYDREAGKVFAKLMELLDIKECMTPQA